MQMQLPISPVDFNNLILTKAFEVLPPQMDSKEARVLLTAIALQESGLAHRWQVVDAKRPQLRGPARGLLQFEQGSNISRGGVWGVVEHPASRYWMHRVCAARGVTFTATAIWHAIEHDDVLAAAAARLLLFTDPRRLPDLGDEAGAWNLYMRTWRPGKPHRGTWPDLYAQALAAVTGGVAT